jgi:hypothetical protein
MRSLMPVFVAFFLVIVGGAGSGHAAPIVIDFEEGFPTDPYNLGFSYLTASGFTIASVTGTPTVFPTTLGTYMDGSADHFLSFTGGVGEAITISRDVSLFGTFNLDSLVLGTFSGGTPAAFSITSGPLFQTGTAAGVSVVTPGFTNLSSVVIQWTAGSELAIDHINLSDFVAPAAVPEPASTAALCFGSLALVVRRMRRRNAVLA